MSVEQTEKIQALLKEIEPLIRPDAVFSKVTDAFKALKKAVEAELKEAVWADYLAKRKG